MTIDTHHHILPDFFWRETNDSHAPVGGLAPLQWSKETMVSFMDDAGIDVAVMSVSTPGVHLGDSEKARSLARRCNEFAADLVHTRPARFAIIDEMAFTPGGEERGTATSMFRRMYWDTALAASDPVLRMLRDMAGIDQVLFGTDFPYLRRDLAENAKQRILQSSELIDSERCAVLGDNAARLFPHRA
jgi:predicted TIM-barrel fold metal-dependent hydrolase